MRSSHVMCFSPVQIYHVVLVNIFLSLFSYEVLSTIRPFLMYIANFSNVRLKKGNCGVD
jgi:hypothetical protein